MFFVCVIVSFICLQYFCRLLTITWDLIISHHFVLILVHKCGLNILLLFSEFEVVFFSGFLLHTVSNVKKKYKTEFSNKENDVFSHKQINLLHPFLVSCKVYLWSSYFSVLYVVIFIHLLFMFIWGFIVSGPNKENEVFSFENTQSPSTPFGEF